MARQDVDIVRLSGLFDEEWYLSRYPEVAQQGVSPLEHYLDIGWRLNHLPSLTFDPSYYLDMNPDVAGSDINPLYHFARWGRHENRSSRAVDADLSAAAAEIAFSIILPTYNRRKVVGGAIDSILRQNHRNFELIVVDDGSTDDTEAFVRTTYAGAMAAGRLVYVRLSRNLGVCAARNAGLLLARCPWVAYIDSDNAVRPRFLDVFAWAIVANSRTMAFYAKFFHEGAGEIYGQSFDLEDLKKYNFIDLGVFVHNIDCFRALGGFDLRLKRFVDWDLVLNYTQHFMPMFIDEVLLDYRASNRYARITTSVPFALAKTLILKKHYLMDTVTTVVMARPGQEAHVRRAIESALDQKGDFFQDIVIAVESGSDDLSKIALRYRDHHPERIRVLMATASGRGPPFFKRCIEVAAGQYLAFLDSDDYWTDDRKLLTQVAFLSDNQDCSMVFSRILVEDAETSARSPLHQQERLSSAKLDGADFLAQPSLDLIASLSSCMFRSSLMKRLPAILYNHRVSEIALAFHLERYGRIGHLPQVMGVCRRSPGDAGGARETCEIVRLVARERYRPTLQAMLDRDSAGIHGTPSRG